MDQKRKRLWICCFFILTALWIAFIITRSLQPNYASAEESGFVLEIFHIEPSKRADFIVRKLAHVTEFFILESLLWTDFRLTVGKKTIPPLLLGLAVAAVDEGIQTQVPGRAGRLTDVAIDFVGVCAACLLLRWIMRLRARRKEKRGKNDGG